jgi:hypothetical protein
MISSNKNTMEKVKGKQSESTSHEIAGFLNNEQHNAIFNENNFKETHCG